MIALQTRAMRTACSVALIVGLAWCSPLSRRASARARSSDARLESRARFALNLKAPHEPGELVVKLRDATSKAATRAIESLGCRMEERNAAVPSLVRVAGDDDARMVSLASALEREPDVEYVEPNYLYFEQTSPNDSQYSQQWGLHQSSGIDIGAEQAWERTTGSDDVVVGVIDSGMDIKHKDLKDNLYKNPGEIPGNNIDDDGNGYIDDVNGWDAVTDSGAVKDQDGHGTHVSGTVGARGNNSEGVTGVNWRVKLLPLRFITVRSGSLFDAIQCIDYAVRLRTSGVNLRVLNNSWGGGPYTQALYDAIKRANDAGIVFVCAAGNDASDSDSLPSYPASYEVPNVISVGAMSRGDFAASFSNFGKRSVDVFAPGEDILSTLPGDGYGSFSGTSQASPHVAGIGGLIVAASPTSSVAQIKARILGGAVSDHFASSLCLTGGRVSAAISLKPDATPPESLSDFHLAAVTRSTVLVNWTAVGDDGTSGKAAYYDIRWSTSPITTQSFEDAIQLDDTRVPLAAGQQEAAVVRGCFTADQPVYVAMRVFDKGGNFAESATLMAVPTGGLQLFSLGPGPADDGSLGTPLNLKGDDKALALDLPFDFPYFGASYRTVYVSTNGLVSFGGAVLTPSGNRSDLGALSAIAPLWLDLTTAGSLVSNEDVYMKSTATSVTLRWIAEIFFDSKPPLGVQPVTFAVTLHADGSIDYVYGPGNNRDLQAGGSNPIVGFSDGGCSASVLDGYSSQPSLADAPALTLRPATEPGDEAPIVTSSTTTPSGVETTTLQFTVTARGANGETPSLVAALPRNATFDAGTGAVRFTPDSGQNGPVPFVFTATGVGGITSRTVVANVLDNPDLPQVKFIEYKKKKVIFDGSGFRVGASVEIDGAGVADAKSLKKSPATRITSKSATASLTAPGLHTVVVVNPDGRRSGPYFVVR